MQTAEFDPDHQALFPFYPLTEKGMPLPGPDFLQHAIALGDPPITYSSGPAKYRVMEECGPILQQLYYDAMYTTGFNMPIRVKGRPVTTTFIRGHLWGYAPSGPRRARVMVIGKWPGVEEAKMGRNFVGPSGQITVRALEAAGLEPEEYSKWYITNVIHHPNLDPSSTTATKPWLKNCRPILEQELRLVRPTFILLLGAEATKTILGDHVKVDSAQGGVFEYRIPVNRPGYPQEFHTAKVMACIHPARVAITADKLPEFNNGIARFVKLVRGEDLENSTEVVDHRLVYKERDLEKIVDDIIEEGLQEKEPQIIAIDGEWHGDYPTEDGAWLRTIQFSHKPKFAVGVVLRKCGGDYAFIPSSPCKTIEEAVARQLRRLLVNTPTRRVRLAGHNLRADLPWIYHGLDQDLGKTLMEQFTGPATPEDTRTAGGFDTMMAAHAVTEAPGDMGFKLEVLALNICGVRRYDDKLHNWKIQYCKELGIKAKDLDGYGMCPDEVLCGVPIKDSTVTVGTSVSDSYACWDADATRRLVHFYNRPGGLLDCDQYSQSSRIPFWISMRASPGFLEMEMTGLLVDTKRGDQLTDLFLEARNELAVKLRKMINWEGFNPSSHQQCATLLFGHELAGKLDKKGELVNVAPPEAVKLDLTPITSTGKPPKPWEYVVKRRLTDVYRPSTGKEVLGILVTRLHQADPFKASVVQTLRHIRFAGQVLHGMLREPLKDDLTGLPICDEDDERTYDGGILFFIGKDGRVHTHIFPTKETGRCSTTRPSVQNFSKRRETDYKIILGSRYCFPLRSVVSAPDGWVLVEADYMGAELAMMAIQARSKSMIDHCMRANHKESDPRFYDIHANMAVKAFQLTVNDYVADKDGLTCAQRLKLPIGAPLPPTKKGLKAAGQESLRTAAKTIMFGVPYGRGTAAVVRAVEEEGVLMTVDDGDRIRASIFESYPELEGFFEECELCVTNPGHMTNCFGRRRRFQQTGVEGSGELERQARNFRIQAGVADLVSRAIDNLYSHPERFDSRGDPKYLLALQMHDAVLFQVRIEHLEWFLGTPEAPGVLQSCMTNSIPIYTCGPSGVRIPGAEPYYMGVEYEVMQNWGVKIPLATGTKLGVPARFCEQPK